MNLIESVVYFFQKRKIQKEFRSYLSPGVITLMECDPKIFVQPPLEMKHFQYIIVSIDDLEVQELSNVLEIVSETVFQNKAILNYYTQSVVVACFGFPFPDTDHPELRINALKAILESCGSKIRIAHGQCNGYVGNIGGSKRFSWGGIIPNLNKLMEKLYSQPFGTAFEVTENPS